MNREQAISTIEALYPIDSQYADTNEIGERLLAQAKREVEDWRTTLSDAVLIRYADLCQQEEAKPIRVDRG